jgi:hypothetical protein
MKKKNIAMKLVSKKNIYSNEAYLSKRVLLS